MYAFIFFFYHLLFINGQHAALASTFITHNPRHIYFAMPAMCGMSFNVDHAETFPETVLGIKDVG